MSRNATILDVPIQNAFDTLSDPETYAEWVVGAKEVRASQESWPEVGSTFHHTQGAGPVNLRDTTIVLEADPPRCLVLEVRARPWFVGRVELHLEERGPEQTQVVMIERPVAGLTRYVYNPLIDLLAQRRNAEALRRLEKISQRRRGQQPRAA